MVKLLVLVTTTTTTNRYFDYTLQRLFPKLNLRNSSTPLPSNSIQHVREK